MYYYSIRTSVTVYNKAGIPLFSRLMDNGDWFGNIEANDYISNIIDSNPKIKFLFSKSENVVRKLIVQKGQLTLQF